MDADQLGINRVPTTNTLEVEGDASKTVLEGAETFSETRSITFSPANENQTGTVFPNPVATKTQQLLLPVYLSKNTTVRIQIFDLQGRRMNSYHFELETGNHFIKFWNNWPSGSYQMVVKIDDLIDVQRFVVQD